MLRFIIHYGIHFLVPIFIGYLCYPKKRFWAIVILLSGLVIDIDHLWANPVFDPDRCSIGFHFLHGYLAIGFYTLLLAHTKTRIFGWAFLIHILADFVDCVLLRLQF
ncbi:DUF6122 family protein [Allomuricauda sp. SCSIO 65647]|uniref:DUF6122 family protein n=1 Tax=Allomuricauda sp. SCSIO 65647 TaxID=2908843 RepID=UPI001F44D5AB|nr:DUF6122 family protein [Muricauda sp. SCSIO 65647]UJH67890.1 DUF6122 family protein [Muricauda sp. SCSIO 65647]